MRKLVASCSAILMAGLALAACGGSSSSAKAGATNPLSGVSGGATGSNSSGNDDFAKLVSDANKQKFKITFTSGSGGDETVYEQDGNGNSVYGSGGSQTFTSASGTVSCETDSDGRPSASRRARRGQPVPRLLQPREVVHRRARRQLRPHVVEDDRGP